MESSPEIKMDRFPECANLEVGSSAGDLGRFAVVGVIGELDVSNVDFLFTDASAETGDVSLFLQAWYVLALLLLQPQALSMSCDNIVFRGHSKSVERDWRQSTRREPVVQFDSIVGSCAVVCRAQAIQTCHETEDQAMRFDGGGTVLVRLMTVWVLRSTDACL